MIFLCFFASGVAALVYEVVWLRMLALVFGHTVHAVTAVLTAMMAGLGLGSALISRIADRRPDRLVIYGALEGAIGVWGALIPWLLSPVVAVYLGLHRALALSDGAFTLVQFVLAFVLLLPATTFMGATLPLLARAVTREATAAARDVGALYALNTFGAVLGAAAAGYALLPALGIRVTACAAAALNVVIGLVAIALGRRAREPRAAARAEADAGPGIGDSAGAWSAGAIVVPAALGLSGAAAMVYEVAWTRVLALVIGSSTYAFTAMLVAFLAGIAIGSAVFARLPLVTGRRPGTLAAILVAVAVSALVMIPTFDRFPGLVASAVGISSEPVFVLSVQVGLSVLLMLGPTLLIGATFPCAVGLLARDRHRTGRDVARLYAANTGGAIVGAALAGLVLVPGLGAQNAVKVGAVLHLLAAAVALGMSFGALSRWRRVAAAGLAAAVLAGALLIPPWNRSVMASGVAVYANDYARIIDKISIGDFMRTYRLLFYEEGPTATVTVHESTYRLLRANGKTEASNGPDMHTQLLLGHLPLLVHPHPRHVLVIGLGSGVTVAAVARHPVARIDVVEIEPAMTRAARLFERENRNVLADPRVRVTIADARNFLLTRPDRYDVIVAEPSNPWIGGVATLFTAEFYALAAARLQPGGLMLQWIQGYAMAPADLKMVVGTLRTVFPATTIWSAAHGDYLLMGSVATHPLPLDRVAARYAASAGIREDFARSGLVSAEALLADFVLDEAATAGYAEGAHLNTDDRLPLEFSAPRSLYADTTEENWRLLRGFRSADLPRALDRPEVRHAVGVAYVAKGLPDEALAQFDRALARDPGHVPSLLERGRLLRRLGKPAEALAPLEAAARRASGNAEVQFELGVARQAQAGPAAALQAYGRAVALAPERADYMRAYATALAQAGRADEALGYLLLARALQPRDPALMDLAAFIYLQLGNIARGVELLRQAVAVAPDEAIYHFRLGQAQMQNKNPEAAIAGLRRAAELRPDFVEAHLELANTYLATDQVGRAVAEYRRVIALDPNNRMALRILTTLQR